MNDIALVFTMHKVGSSTLMQAVRQAGMTPERGSQDNLQYLLSQLQQYNGVITAVRDPVARNISWLFEKHGPDIATYHNEQLLDFFLGNGELHRHIDHFTPLEWFKNVYQPFFDVNVFSKRFAKTRGWSILNKRHIILQIEQAETAIPESFKKLYNVDIQAEHRAETHHTRPYGETYKRFVDWIKLPSYYLDMMYDSKYAQHFYTKKQIAEMRARWQ